MLIPLNLYSGVFYYELVICVGKIRLFVRARKHGSRVDSVPLNQLVRLSKSRKKSWVFQKTIDNDGWLILEAYG